MVPWFLLILTLLLQIHHAFAKQIEEGHVKQQETLTAGVRGQRKTTKSDTKKKMNKSKMKKSKVGDMDGDDDDESSEEGATPPDNTAFEGLTDAVFVEDDGGMVSTGHPLATEAGVKVLEAGGTAADAWIAAMSVIGLVEPQSSGLGGSGFVMYYAAETGKLTAFDGSKVAPAAATEDRFAFSGGSFFAAWQTGLAVGVPGTARLMEALHKQHGVSDWSSLFESAIDLATNGFPNTGRTFQQISLLLAAFTGFCANRAQFFRNDAFFEYFAFPENCTAKPPGTLMVNPDYAGVLQAMADAGNADPFYTGEIAQDIVDTVTGDTSLPGDMTLQDLLDYTVVEREVVCGTFKGHDVCGMPPPSAGGLAVAQLLTILDNFIVEGSTLDPENVHLFTQANRLAFADRAFVGDPAFVTVPIEGMLDAEYLKERAALIDLMQDTVAEPGTPPGVFDPVNPTSSGNNFGTSHFSIVDSYGNVLSATLTVQAPFGNGARVRGFQLNNELTLFSLLPTDSEGNLLANRVQGGKRPSSSMSPTIVMKDGKPVLATGSPGGTSIIGYTAQSIWNVLQFGLSAQEAIQVPHYLNGNSDSTSIEEPRFPITLDYNATALKEALGALGHTVEIAASSDPFAALDSGLGVIQFGDGLLIGGADERRDNTVAGV